MAFEAAILESQAKKALAEHQLSMENNKPAKTQRIVISGEHSAAVAHTLKDLIVQAASASIMIKTDENRTTLEVPHTVLRQARIHYGMAHEVPATQKPAKKSSRRDFLRRGEEWERQTASIFDKLDEQRAERDEIGNGGQSR